MNVLTFLENFKPNESIATERSVFMLCPTICNTADVAQPQKNTVKAIIKIEGKNMCLKS